MFNYMVDSFQIDRLFYSLSDATRRDILERLRHGELSVNEIASLYSVSLADISKHLKVLHEAGLVTKRKDGRKVFVSTNLEALYYGEQYLMQYRTTS